MRRNTNWTGPKLSSEKTQNREPRSPGDLDSQEKKRIWQGWCFDFKKRKKEENEERKQGKEGEEVKFWFGFLGGSGLRKAWSRRHSQTHISNLSVSEGTWLLARTREQNQRDLPQFRSLVNKHIHTHNVWSEEASFNL